MGALTNIYVDPAIAGNSGTGTIGDPYGDLQYALNTATRDATNGNQINVKAGTAEVLTATLSFATFGAPTSTAPCLIRGYTAAANDGGVGSISGAAAYTIINGTNFVSFVDMELHNSGSNPILATGQYATLLNCRIHNSTGNAINAGFRNIIERCFIENVAGIGVSTASSSMRIANTTFVDGANKFTDAINISAGDISVINNIIYLSSNNDGIVTSGSALNFMCQFNSIAANGSTGVGILIDNSDGMFLNNIVSGFSGAGGRGIATGSGRQIPVYGYNAVYNCTTAYSITSDVTTNLGNNITLSNSPFTNAAGGDFSIAAAAKAELESQGWPSSFLGISTNQYLDPGAAQIEPVAGGLLVHPGMSGGMRG